MKGGIMNLKNTCAYLLTFFFIVCFCMSAGYALAIDMNEKAPSPAQPTSPQKKLPQMQLSPGDRLELKPDLIVQRLNMEVTSMGAENWRMKVIVTVKNQGGATSSRTLTAEGAARRSGGSFKAKIEFTDDRSPYVTLCESGVTALAAGATKDFYCQDTIPRETFRRYRATVDSLDWIDESNETNNQQTNSLLTR
jgi:hypothetical protein